jgi:hypothetical protein
MVSTRLRKSSQETDVEPVDSCTKLLDQEISDKRERRKSMPFFLPSRYSNQELLSKHKKDSKESMDETSNREMKLKWLLFLDNYFSNKFPSSNATSRKSVKEKQCSKKNLAQGKPDKYENERRFSQNQNEEFYTTWKRIQGSRICLNDEENGMPRK